MGSSCRYSLKMDSRALSSGGGTKKTLSNRPVRLKALSTSQGALVAPMMRMFSLSLSTPSIWAKKALMVEVILVLRSNSRLRPRASISSIKITQGRLARAVSNSALMFFSLLPTYISKIWSIPML